MNVTAFSENCGAVVSDLQLATMSNHELLELRALFAKYGLLFFRDQDLTPDQHLKFANRFGRIVINKFFKTTDDFPQILAAAGIQIIPMMISLRWGLF
jgi:taurine dioxygenase